MIALGSEERLGTRGFVMMFLGRFLAAIFLFIIAFVVSTAQDAITAGALTLFNVNPADATTVAQVTEYIDFAIQAAFAVSVLLIIGSFILTWLEYFFFTFELLEFGLRLRRGIIYRKEITIPYRHMQDINVNRDLLYRIFGVSSLIIESAGHEEPDEESESDVVLAPIDWEKAAEIREFLQRKIAVQIITSETTADREAGITPAV